MKACLGTTREVNDLCDLAKKSGLRVEKTKETAKIFDGETLVYQGLKKGGLESWIVRFNPSVFENRRDREETTH